MFIFIIYFSLFRLPKTKINIFVSNIKIMRIDQNINMDSW